MKRIILIAMTILLPLLMNACHTVEGVGEDIQSAGRAMQKAAR